MTKQYGVSIKGLGIALPETIIKNDDLTQLVETDDEWISSRTGFRQRRVVSGDEQVTDLAIASAKEALAFAGMTGEDIDLIILASSTPDNIYPAGSAMVQQGIGAPQAFGFDLMMGCSGLIYGLGIAAQFIENGTVQTALIVGADTHSRYTDWYDRNTCVLFGDGAGAMILKRHETPGETDLLAMDFMLDGSKGQQIKLPLQRANCPLVEPRKEIEKSAIYMNGREVFKFAVTQVPLQMEKALEKANLTPQDIDYYVLHQANARIMGSMSERMNIRPEQLVVSLENYGNTSAASIPLALNDFVVNGTIHPGQTLLFCGFGAGLAIATAIFKWNCVDQRKLDSAEESPAASLTAS